MSSTESEKENQKVSISSNSVYNSVAYDPVSESKAEAAESTNYKAQNQTLWLVYYSASASDSDNLLFTRSLATESQAEWAFCFWLFWFDFRWIVSLDVAHYGFDYDSVANENQHLSAP